MLSSTAEAAGAAQVDKGLRLPKLVGRTKHGHMADGTLEPMGSRSSREVTHQLPQQHCPQEPEAQCCPKAFSSDQVYPTGQ
jgi:hypothetical protein